MGLGKWLVSSRPESLSLTVPFKFRKACRDAPLQVFSLFFLKRKACLPLTRPQDTHGSCLSWNKSSSMSALRQDEPCSWPLHGGGG